MEKLPLECKGNLALWEASLTRRIEANQQLHMADWPTGVQACIKGHDFWTSKYYYTHKALDAWMRETSVAETVRPQGSPRVSV
eukprot:4105631-Amphidinium_carterae.1